MGPVFHRLRYARELAGHKQTASERGYEELFDEKIRFPIKVQRSHKVYTDGLPRRVRRLELVTCVFRIVDADFENKRIEVNSSPN